MKSHFRAFTIIELAVVICIIGILAAIIIPEVYKAIDKANITYDMNNVKNLNTYLQLYNVENNYYPESDTEIQNFLESNNVENIATKSKNYIFYNIKEHHFELRDLSEIDSTIFSSENQDNFHCTMTRPDELYENLLFMNTEGKIANVINNIKNGCVTLSELKNIEDDNLKYKLIEFCKHAIYFNYKDNKIESEFYSYSKDLSLDSENEINKSIFIIMNISNKCENFTNIDSNSIDIKNIIFSDLNSVDSSSKISYIENAITTINKINKSNLEKIITNDIESVTTAVSHQNFQVEIGDKEGTKEIGNEIEFIFKFNKISEELSITKTFIEGIKITKDYCDNLIASKNKNEYECKQFNCKDNSSNYNGDELIFIMPKYDCKLEIACELQTRKIELLLPENISKDNIELSYFISNESSKLLDDDDLFEIGTELKFNIKIMHPYLLNTISVNQRKNNFTLINTNINYNYNFKHKIEIDNNIIYLDIIERNKYKLNIAVEINQTSLQQFYNYFSIKINRNDSSIEYKDDGVELYENDNIVVEFIQNDDYSFIEWKNLNFELIKYNKNKLAFTMPQNDISICAILKEKIKIGNEHCFVLYLNDEAIAKKIAPELNFTIVSFENIQVKKELSTYFIAEYNIENTKNKWICYGDNIKLSMPLNTFPNFQCLIPNQGEYEINFCNNPKDTILDLYIYKYSNIKLVNCISDKHITHECNCYKLNSNYILFHDVNNLLKVIDKNTQELSIKIKIFKFPYGEKTLLQNFEFQFLKIENTYFYKADIIDINKTIENTIKKYHGVLKYEYSIKLTEIKNGIYLMKDTKTKYKNNIITDDKEYEINKNTGMQLLFYYNPNKDNLIRHKLY